MNTTTSSPPKTIRWGIWEVTTCVALAYLLSWWANRRVYLEIYSILWWHAILQSVFILLPCIIIFGFCKQDISQVNWKPYRLIREIILSLIAFVLLFAAYAFTILFLKALAGKDLTRSELEWLTHFRMMSTLEVYLFVLTTFLVGPISEELFFRGFVYQGLKTRLPVTLALVIQALLFSLIHIDRNVPAKLWLVVLGLFLGWVYQKRQNLVMPICLHMAINVVVVGIPWVHYMSSPRYPVTSEERQTQKEYVEQLESSVVQDQMRQIKLSDEYE